MSRLSRRRLSRLVHPRPGWPQALPQLRPAPVRAEAMSRRTSDPARPPLARVPTLAELDPRKAAAASETITDGTALGVSIADPDRLNQLRQRRWRREQAGHDPDYERLRVRRAREAEEELAAAIEYMRERRIRSFNSVATPGNRP